MQELLHKRSYNAKHFDLEKGEKFLRPKVSYRENPDDVTKPFVEPVLDILGNQEFEEVTVEFDGQYRQLNYHSGHIHYLKDGSFEPLDWKLLWDDIRRGWYFETHSYNPFLPEFSDGWAEFRDRFHDKDQTVRYKAIVQNVVKGELIETDETNPNFDDNIDNKGVLYRNAFGENRDYMLYNTRSSLVKVATVNNPNECTEDAVFEWEVEFPDKELFRVDKKEDAEDMTAKKTKTNTEDGKLVGYKLERRDGKNFNTNKLTLIGDSNLDGKEWYTYLKSFKAWDSVGNTIEIVARISFVNGKAILKKTIPLEFLKTAIGRVFTDTTTSFYAGDGDGALVRAGSSWSDATGGTSATSINNDASVYININRYSTGAVTLTRGMFPIDTSTIPDTDTISSANFYFSTAAGGASADSTALALCEASQTSTSSLEANDFDNIGTTKLADNIEYSSITGGGTFNFALNATGLALINKTGYTKLAVTTELDRARTDPGTPASTKLNYVEFKFSNSTGTTYDPYLSVTYAAGGGGSTNTTNFFQMF